MGFSESVVSRDHSSSDESVEKLASTVPETVPETNNGILSCDHVNVAVRENSASLTIFYCSISESKREQKETRMGGEGLS